MAARPVGASRTEFTLTSGKILISDETSDVLPVPAYPFSRKRERGSEQYKKCAIKAHTSLCPDVGTCGNCDTISSETDCSILWVGTIYCCSATGAGAAVAGVAVCIGLTSLVVTSVWRVFSLWWRGMEIVAARHNTISIAANHHVAFSKKSAVCRTPITCVGAEKLAARPPPFEF